MAPLTPSSITGQFDPIVPEETAQPDSQSFTDVVKSSIGSAFQQTVQAAQNQAGALLDEYAKQIKNSTGQDLFSNRFERQQAVEDLSRTQYDLYPELQKSLPNLYKYNFDPNKFDEKVQQLRQQFPNADFATKPFSELQQDYVNQAKTNIAQANAKENQAIGTGGLKSGIAQFLGNQIGLMKDPRNLLPMLAPMGEGLQFGKGALTALSSLAKTFGFGAAAMIPLEAQQEQVQKGLGEQPTNTQFFENLAAGGVGAVGFGLLGKLATHIFNKFKDPNFDLGKAAADIGNMEIPKDLPPTEQAAMRGAKATAANELEMYKDLGITHPDQLPQVKGNIDEALRAFEEGRPPNLVPKEIATPENTKLQPLMDQIDHNIGQLSSDPAKLPEGVTAAKGVIVPSEQTQAQLQFASPKQALGYIAHSNIDPQSVSLAFDHTTGKYTLLDNTISPEDVAPVGNKKFGTYGEAQRFAGQLGLGKDNIVSLKDGWSVIETAPDQELRDRLSQTPFSYITKNDPSQVNSSNNFLDDPINFDNPGNPLPKTQDVLAQKNSQVMQTDKVTPEQIQQSIDYVNNQIKIQSKLDPQGLTGLQLDKDLPISQDLKSNSSVDSATYQATLTQVKSFIKEFSGCIYGQ